MEHNNNDKRHHYSQNPDQSNQDSANDSMKNQDRHDTYKEEKDFVQDDEHHYKPEHHEESALPYSTYNNHNHPEESAATTEGPNDPEQNYQNPYRRSSSEESSLKQSKQKNSWVSGVFGGLIGSVISAVIITSLFTNGIIDIGNESSETATNSSEQTAVQVDGTPIVEELAAEDANVSTNIEEVAETVVGVVNLQQQSVWTGSEEAGTGSGIIYKKEDGKAYVVTNQHVVDGAEEVEVVLNEEERIPAQVLGEDPLTDLAVLEIDGEKVSTVANIGSSENLVVGETVLAIGNPLGLEFANSVTKGIISGLNRSVSVDTNGDMQADWVTEVIQTDAAINPGNSGGALVNADGDVIGINSMKIAQGAVEGIGFAIPVDAALPIMEELEAEGEVTRPQIGISTASLYQVPPQYRYEINLPDDVEGGMVIADVQPNSPADRAGLQQFDVITKIDRNEVTSILELRKYLYSETTVGDDLEIEYIRDGETHTTNLQLVEMEQE
ncbi:S1C family serine protease [Oceanobacillus salinisoli]|uniref:S1C family serine protease n=1 Tax=Oceanobacillus salinisoli TaxID=2678611 RepID=UPI001E47441E|nr:S1C family serine protease [Oceanobacillus salinisoli]